MRRMQVGIQRPLAGLHPGPVLAISWKTRNSYVDGAMHAGIPEDT
jgi:hypothetical protein